MEFGFAHIPSTNTEENVQLVQLAESLGYDWAWVADQTFYPDPYVVLTTCALSTTRIRLGIGVTNPYTRHPAMTARAAATVNELAQNRFVLGLGAGNRKELVLPLGLSGRAPAHACREAIQVLRGLWSGEPISFLGEHFQVDNLKLEFPVAADIPVYIGGRGPMILSLAGEAADGVILSLSAIDRSLELVAGGANRANRDPSALYHVAWGECAILDGGADLERYRLRLAHSLWRAPEKGLKVSKIPADEIAMIKSSYESGGAEAAARHVSDNTLRQQIIAGTAEECVEQLRLLETKGIESYALLIKETAYDRKDAAIRSFATLVMDNM